MAATPRSVIIVHPGMERLWPFTADHLRDLWQRQGDVEFHRLGEGDDRPVHLVVREPAGVTRMVVLGASFTVASADAFSGLRELGCPWAGDVAALGEAIERLRQRGVRIIQHANDSSFWGASVAEFALALTLCAMRGVHAWHQQIVERRDASRWMWYTRRDAPFVNRTVERKRVRIVGAGNIASRYGDWMRMLGADVSAYDPFAAEPCFHRAGMRREWHLDRLVEDADIFAPMVPLTPKTRGVIDARLIDALPRGCLVVLVTRAEICDMAALRRRVLADELSLAADVFDVEPLPHADPLIGRGNVLHTPHAAGSTPESGLEFAESLVDQFLPVRPGAAVATAAAGRP